MECHYLNLQNSLNNREKECLNKPRQLHIIRKLPLFLESHGHLKHVAHKIPNRNNPKTSSTQHIILKHWKENTYFPWKILKIIREKHEITFKGNPMRLIDFNKALMARSSESMQSKLKKKKTADSQLTICYPGKSSFINEGKINTFQEIVFEI